MAIARIAAPIDWFYSTAEKVDDLPRLKRELLRAPERRSLMAELMADEVRELARRLPSDVRVARALLELEAAEEREACRPKPPHTVAPDLPRGRIKDKLGPGHGRNPKQQRP